MSDILFSNYFGTFNDFENLKRWFRINSEVYKDIIVAVKERSDLEIEYSTRLSKINARIIKAFSHSLGSVSVLWSKAAQFMNDEVDAHKNMGTQICEEVYKPLIQISEEFNTLKKPIENEIDKSIKLYQEKRDEECKLKKKAFLATKETEKSFENSEEFKSIHPSSVSGLDKEKAKIEKRALQCLEISTKAESDYIESSLISEAVRHKWEQSYLAGLEKLQQFETDRLNSMQSVIESYSKCISKIPAIYVDISNKILKEVGIVSIRDDLFENAMHFTNKNPNIYKTEQLMLYFYAESNGNKMNINRRKDNLMKHIRELNLHQTTSDNLRTGILKMLTVYDQTSQFADTTARNQTKREYSKSQCQMNLLSSNLYKIHIALNIFDQKPELDNPLLSLGVKILYTKDRNGLIQAVLESNSGTIVPFYDTGTIARSDSNNCPLPNDDYDEFADNSYTEQPTLPPKRIGSQLSYSSSNSSSGVSNNPISAIPPVQRTVLNKLPKPPRPLPKLPSTVRCQAMHDFVGRDSEELTFNEGDIIIITNKLNDVWWQGQLGDKSGLVPTNYMIELM